MGIPVDGVKLIPENESFVILLVLFFSAASKSSSFAFLAPQSFSKRSQAFFLKKLIPQYTDLYTTKQKLFISRCLKTSYVGVDYIADFF